MYKRGRHDTKDRNERNKDKQEERSPEGRGAGDTRAQVNEERSQTH